MKKILLVFCLVMFASNSMAANINIGPNGCSLADAIRSANSNSSHGNCASGSGTDYIIAPDDWVVVLSSELPTITSNLTIRSESADGLFYISGNNAHRVLKITGSDTNVTLNRVQIYDGQTNTQKAPGILIIDATVRLENSIVVGNNVSRITDFGSGLFAIIVENGDLTIDSSRLEANGNEDVGVRSVKAVDSSLRIVDSTFLHNSNGGIFAVRSGLWVENSFFEEIWIAIEVQDSSATISNSTFADILYRDDYNYVLNTLKFSNSVLVLNHTTISNNVYVNGGALSVSNSFIPRCTLENDVDVQLNSHNLSQRTQGYPGSNCLGNQAEDYFLAPPADNGGPTKTKSFLSLDSAAIDAGDPTYCQGFDQRGEPRGPKCDVGAYEAIAQADMKADAEIEPGAPYGSEQQITYFAQVTNRGPDVADDVRVRIEATNATIDNVDSEFCNSADCIVDSIQPDQTLYIPVQMTLKSYAYHNFQVELSVHTSADSIYTDANEDDPGGNNNKVLSYDINPAADMAVSMELNTSPPYQIGQRIEYEATITNHGGQTANAAALSFDPDNLSNIVFTGCVSASGEICNLGKINKGASKAISIQADIDADQFNAVATVGSDLLDPDDSNNTDDENNGGGVYEADIAIQLSVIDPAPYTSLQYIQFKILVTAGTQAASNLRVYYEFPGAEFITIDGCAGYPCLIPLLEAKGEIELTARFYAPLAIPGSVDQWSMRALVLPGQVDPDLSNNEATIAAPLNLMADVGSQLKLLSEPPFYAGQEIQYSLRILNGGPNSATKVSVEMARQNLTLVYAGGDVCPTVNCDITKLNAFDEENMTLVYKIDDIGEFDLTSNAYASELDTSPDDNLDDRQNGGVALAPPAAPPEDTIFSDGFEEPEI